MFLPQDALDPVARLVAMVMEGADGEPGWARLGCSVVHCLIGDKNGRLLTPAQRIVERSD